jgi:transposase InsO family protein
VTPTAVAAATEADQQLLQVRNFVVDGWPSAKRAVPTDLQVFWTIRDELSTVCNGQCIMRGNRLIVPPSLQSAVLDLTHEGHPGIIRMKQKCRQSVWWPGIDRSTEDYVRDCVACVVSGKSVRPVPGPFQPVPLPQGPWRKLALDFTGEFVAAPAHQRYLLVAIDYYSKWPEVAMCGSPTSAAIITFLTGLFHRFGLIEEIVTDNGVQFTSTEFADFLKLHGIRHCRTALYSPQANAEAERFNRVLKEGIRAAMTEGKSFSTGVRQTLAAYRMTVHATTGVSPASLMLAFPARTPLSILRPVNWTHRQPSPLSQSRQADAVAKRVSWQQQKSTVTHDRRFRAAPSRTVVGDSVRIRLPSRAHKLALLYSKPFQVTAIRGNCVVLENGQRWNLRRCLRHQSSLRPSLAHGTENQSVVQPSQSARQHLPPPQHDTEPEESDAAYFTFETLAAAQPQAGPSGPRRSNRVRRHKNFSSFIKY